MELLVNLWLPTLASAVAVVFAAMVCWTVLPHHKGDTSALPDEDAFMERVRGLGVPRGNYLFPWASHKESSSAEFKQKWERGPAGLVSIWPAKVNMARSFVLSFLVYLAVSFGIAYLGSVTLPAGAGFWRVFQVLGTAGVLAYGFAHLPKGIWFQEYNRTLVANLVDGVLYGLLTGAIFAALWPAAAAA